MNEIMFVIVSTEKDLDLIQIGSALSSARATGRFLKRFQKNVLRRPARTCVEARLRLCRLGSVSASRLDPLLSNLELRFRMVNGQPQCKARVAGSEAAHELEAKISDVIKGSLQS